MSMDNQGLLIAGENVFRFPRLQRAWSRRTYPAFPHVEQPYMHLRYVLGVKYDILNIDDTSVFGPPNSLASTAYFQDHTPTLTLPSPDISWSYTNPQTAKALWPFVITSLIVRQASRAILYYSLTNKAVTAPPSGRLK